MSPIISIRPLLVSDLAAVLTIQAACYPANYLESRETFAAKLQFAPDCTWAVCRDDDVLGYLFTHPWQGDTPPALDRCEQPWPSTADRFYLHDLAIHPTVRGLRLSVRLAEHALAWAKQQGFHMAMLVAVGNATPFWQKLGFTAVALESSALAKYGDATLMKKEI